MHGGLLSLSAATAVRSVGCTEWVQKMATVSPVVKADARFSGSVLGLHVNVWFRDKSEIDALIGALTKLRDTFGDDFDHVHLQHHSLTSGSKAELAEVNFFRPGRAPVELDNEMVDKAATWLTEARRTDSSAKDEAGG